MERTADVVGESASFRELLLPEHILGAIADLGFVRPSPVQQQAIPLARLGADVVVQAKAGTGKTLCFAVAAVERVDLASGVPQVLVLAPTREIALQASEVITAVAAGLAAPGLYCGTFIGGLPIEEDERCLRRACHVVVGTPGRLLSLLQRGSLPTSRLAVLVLDEADKLLGSESFRGDVGAILACLPQRKQVLALSATYSEDMLQQLRGMMRRPREVMLCSKAVSLLGIRQLYQCVAPSTLPSIERQPEWRWLFESRVAALLNILTSVSFHQAVVFCNWRRDAEELEARLLVEGYPAAYLSAAKRQLDRIDALNALRDFRLRVAVTTDLAARGIDLDRVNLVVNLDLPVDAATYAHRVGRAGRFGTRGVAVTLVAVEELEALQGYIQEAGGEVQPLPETIPPDWYSQQPSSGGGSAGANGHPDHLHGSAMGAPAGPPAGSPDPAVNGGLSAAFSDVSTASLWYDEPDQELPSSPVWPPGDAGPYRAPQAAASPAASPEAAASGTAHLAALPRGPHAAPSAAAEAGEEDIIDLSYTLVLAAGQPGKPQQLQLQQQQQEEEEEEEAEAAAAAAAAAVITAATSLPEHRAAAAVARHPPGLAGSPFGAAAGAASSASAASLASLASSASDSWASSSDDMLSSSSDESEPGAGAGAGSKGQLGRAGSLPSVIPPRHAHHRHHHHTHTHHSSATLQRCHRQNGSLESYCNEAGLGAATAGAATAMPAAWGVGEAKGSCAQPAAGGPAKLQRWRQLPQPPGQTQAQAHPARALCYDQDSEEGEEEQEHSFRDSWLRGCLVGEQVEARGAGGAGGPGPRDPPAPASAAAQVELRPHAPRGPAATGRALPGASPGSREAAPPPPAAPVSALGAELALGSPAGGNSSKGPAGPRQAAAMSAAPQAGGKALAQAEAGASHYWQLVSSARADLLCRAGAAGVGEGDAGRQLEEAFRLDGRAPAGEGADGSLQGGAAGGAPSSALAPVAAAAAGGQLGDSGGTSEAGKLPAVPTCPQAPPQQQQQRQQHQRAGAGTDAVPALGPAAGVPVPAGKKRRPLGSVQAEAARHRGRQEARRAGASAGSASGPSAAGDLAAEAALLEAWAEGESEEEQGEGVLDEGGDERLPGAAGGGLAGQGESQHVWGGSGGGSSNGSGSTANEEAWRQYWQQHYSYYGAYPSFPGQQGSPGSLLEPPSPAASTAAPAPAGSGFWQTAGHGLAGAPPPPPPPPYPPVHLAPPPTGQAAHAAGRGPLAAATAAAAVAAPGAGVSMPQQAGPAAWGLCVADSEGYVRVPADVLRQYQEAEWHDWRRRYGEWCWVWDQWYAAFWASCQATAQGRQ